jgi:hypothetical protein
LRRGVFHSVPDLVAALEQYLAHYNRHPTPFVWTAKASDILTKVKRARKELSARKKSLQLRRPTLGGRRFAMLVPNLPGLALNFNT